ncbi:MAG: hypothetical protein GSR86_04030 [Desulfurococcales archaeon]|nr:hypothetical protein [Desulfurococcales archaeon]
MDRICVRSGILCPRCESRIASGEYMEWEVRVMKALLDLEDRIRGSVEYVKSHRVGGDVVVFLRSSQGIPVWLGQELSQRLRDLGRVYVVEYHKDPRGLASSLLRPARVVRVDESYLPDGSTILLVRVDSRPKPGVEEAAKRILKIVTGKDVSIEVEARPSTSSVEVERRDVRGILDKLGL